MPTEQSSVVVHCPICGASDGCEACDSISEAKKWDASMIKHPDWSHVQQAFIDGAREAKNNPDATEEDFSRASDGYTKRVFEFVDPVSEAALRTESWAGGK